MRAYCSVPGCDQPHKARGCCTMHYRRLVRNGDPLVTRPHGQPQPLLQRLADKIAVGDGCWEWTGLRSASGYGRLGATGSAHRTVYELLVGPIPGGLELDHLCRNRGCVRPDHLEPVTHAENMRRGHLARLAVTS